MATYPNHVGAHLYLGLVAARRGDRTTANQMVEWLDSRDGPYTFGVPDWDRGRIALLLRDYAEANVLLRRSLQAGRGIRRFRPHGDIDFEAIRQDSALTALFAPRG